MVAPLVISLITKAATSLAIAGVKKGGKALIHKVKKTHGSDPGPLHEILELNQEMFKTLHDIQGSLASIQVALVALSKQLTDAVVCLRRDNLLDTIKAVEGRYAIVTDIITAIQETNAMTPDTEQQSTMHELETRLKKCLVSAVDELPPLLDRVHAFINDQGKDALMRQIAEQALTESFDVIHYYEQVMARASYYWLVYLQGMSLLWMASGESKVLYPEAKQSLARLAAQLTAQQATVGALLGQPVCIISETLLKGQNATLRISVENTQKYMEYERKQGGDLDQPGFVRFTPEVADVWCLTLRPDAFNAVEEGDHLPMYGVQLSAEYEAAQHKHKYLVADAGDKVYYKIDGTHDWFIKPVAISGGPFVIGTFTPSTPLDESKPGHFLISGAETPQHWSEAGTLGKDWKQWKELPVTARFDIEIPGVYNKPATGGKADDKK